MINELFIIFTITTISCIKFEELPKYDTIKVIPDTRVYLDISSFEVGRSIYIEFTMDLFFSKISKDSYTFQIGQVPSKYKDDYSYWSNLPTVTTKNVSSTEKGVKDYTYLWVEIKKPGMNYLYIIPPEPYKDFYTFWKNKIKIKNIGERSPSEIRKIKLIIFISLFIFIKIICIILVAYFKIKKINNRNNKDFAPAATVLELPIINDQNCAPSSKLVQEPEKNNVEYPKPVSPMVSPEQLYH